MRNGTRRACRTAGWLAVGSALIALGCTQGSPASPTFQPGGGAAAEGDAASSDASLDSSADADAGLVPDADGGPDARSADAADGAAADATAD